MNLKLALAAVATVIVAAFTIDAAQKTDSGGPQTPAADRMKAENPVEIGLVDWKRDLDAALAESKQTEKPVFLLFQEVPGCAGCQKFGREVLSHPLLVEAIEDEFIPVVVFNNLSEGKDRQILKRFSEPAWNYQVIRFLDSKGKDIVERKDGIWSVAGVATRMADALKKRQRTVPKYLQTVKTTDDRVSHPKAAFAMHCFWTGEYRLGGINGVIATEAGWLDGREVTLVTYDKDQVNLESLTKQASKVRCADKVYTSDGGSLSGLAGGVLDDNYRTASTADQKRQLSRWKGIRKITGINIMQLTKINSLAPDNVDAALEWLSPRQRESLTNK